MRAQRRSGSDLVVAERGPTSSLDQVAVFVDEDALGVPPRSLEDLRASLSQRPFEPQMMVLATWAAIAREITGSHEEQVRLVRRIFGDSEAAAMILAFLAVHGNAVLFSEQQLLTAQRLTIESAAAGHLSIGLSDLDIARLGLDVIACGSVLSAAARDVDVPDVTSEEQVAYFIRNGAYNSKPQPANEVTRAKEIFEVLVPQLIEEEHPEAQPLDDWMRETHGLGLADQFQVGFALAAMVHAFDDGPEAGDQVRIQRVHLDDLFVKLGWDEGRQAHAERLLSASREEYAAEYEHLGASLQDLVWETRPIMSRPFLRLGDGSLLLTTPRAMQSWMTDGVYYRLLSVAQERGRSTSHRFTSLFGAASERYAVDLTRCVFGSDRPIGGGRVYGEQPYGPNHDLLTSDVIIDLGLDLVVVEVTGSRLSAAMLVHGDVEQLAKELDRMIVGKVRQLGACITALTDGSATIPAGSSDVDIRHVERIWPILVTGNMTQVEPLADLIRERTPGALDHAKVQPLTVLDMNDYETLLGLVEADRDLPQMLTGKATPPFDKLEFRVWLNRASGAPSDAPRPAVVNERWELLVKQLLAGFDFTKGLPRADGSSASR